ncbi:MAG TPA: TrbG/VirB9 family P-type conjugative transfer protein [Sphingomicrobium sp.]|nr:TrbG/VirB9 family P-type conjugative transfer protein [Sphingomicrobium sp.]
MKSAVLSIALTLLTMTAAPAVAIAADARIQSILFKPNSVVRFVGKPGYQSAIRFASDERIENVAVGDSVSWQVTPNKRGDLLFVKPLTGTARSNMMVVTDKRTYLFDMTASRAGVPVYALSFQYPDYPSPGSLQPLVEATSSPVVIAEKQPLAPLPRLNFAWEARGAKALRPARAFDDGKSVYLSWPEKAPLPAVLIPAPDGTESPSNYRMEDGFIIVEGVPGQVIIRRGKDSATVTPMRRRAEVVRTADTETRHERR